MQVKGMVYDVSHPILRLMRTNRWVIRTIFGVRVPKGVAVQFDPTTALLARGLRQLATERDSTSLEVGIGQGALVSLSLAMDKDIQISGVDCTQARVETSQQLADFNGIEASFFQSDLFSEVASDSRFDLIFFNPPYVPTEVGQRLQLTRRLEIDGDQMWDGGVDGTEVLRKFLRQAPAFLSRRGRIVFGVQNIFIADEIIVEIIADSGLVLQERILKRFVPSTGYVVAASHPSEDVLDG